MRSSNSNPSIDDVRAFWDENVCGDVFTSLTDRESIQYLIATRDQRYHYEYHLQPFLKRVAAAAQGGKVIEIGCSQGIDLAELAKLGANVTGFDLSPRAIELARNRFKFEHLNGNFIVGNAEKMEIPDASFDVVYSCGVLHHTPNIKQAFKEVYRILKPGGKIFIMLYSKHSLNNYVHVAFKIPYESPKDLSKDAPVTMTFSKKGIETLLCDFDNLQLQNEYLFGAGWRPLSDIVPTFVNSALGKVMGWHWMIEGNKRG